MDWEYKGKRDGLAIWRAPVGPFRHYVYVYAIDAVDGRPAEVQAKTEGGYIRRCATVEEAKAYLES